MHFRRNRCGVGAALAMAVALAGCANVDLDSQQAWFAKPLDVAGRNAGGYSFSELAESKQRQRPITSAELVDSNGGCPPPPAAPQAQQQPSPGSQSAVPSPTPDTESLLGGGIALGMSECDVVYRAGAPSSVQIGKNPNGDRTAVLTFAGGPRAGIYQFERGALMEMDRVAEQAPPPQLVKKKAAKATKPPKKNAQS